MEIVHKSQLQKMKKRGKAHDAFPTLCVLIAHDAFGNRHIFLMSLFVIVLKNHVLNNEKSSKNVDFFMILAILQHCALFPDKSVGKCPLKKDEFLFFSKIRRKSYLRS